MWLTFLFCRPLKKCYVEKRSIKLCKIPSINKPVSSIASMSETCPSPRPDLEEVVVGAGWRPWRSLHGQRGVRLPLPGVLPRNHAGAEVSGVWLADLAPPDAGCSPHPPPQLTLSTPGPSSSLLADSIQKQKKPGRKNSSPRRKEGAQSPSSPRGILSDSLLSGATSPSVRLHPPRTGLAGPSSSPPGRRCASPQPLHSHRARLGRGLAWSAGPQGPWPLSPVNPATVLLGNLGPPGV